MYEKLTETILRLQGSVYCYFVGRGRWITSFCKWSVGAEESDHFWVGIAREVIWRI